MKSQAILSLSLNASQHCLARSLKLSNCYHGHSSLGLVALQAFEGVEGLLARLLEVDYGMGVVGAEVDVGLLEDGFGGGVGVEEVLGGEGGEFGEVGAQVGAVGVEFFALGDRVEDAEVGRGVGAATGDPLPTGAVVGKVGVKEGVPKPAFAVVPV